MTFRQVLGYFQKIRGYCLLKDTFLVRSEIIVIKKVNFPHC